MSSLINISPDKECPVYVDITPITAIMHANGGTFLFSNDRSVASPHIDITAIAKALEHAGQKFLTLRGIKRDNEDEVILVAPHAITFASVSQPDADRNVGVIFGIKGLGRREIVMPENDWHDLLILMQSNDRPLFSYTPVQAWARWVAPQELHIYPDSITRITGSGRTKQLDVVFDGCGPLDIQLATVAEASALAPDDLRARRTTFADQLATAAGHLIKVQDGKDDIQGPVYMKAKDINIVSLGESGTPVTYELHIHQADKPGSYGAVVTAYFNDRAARNDALLSVQQQLTARTRRSGTQPAHKK